MKCDTFKTGEACQLASDLLIGADTYAGIYQVKKINTTYCIPSNTASNADDKPGYACMDNTAVSVSLATSTGHMA